MSSLEGHIHIGVLAGWIPLSLVTAKLAAFQSRYPRVRITVSATDLDALESELISERLAFAISADVHPDRTINEFVTADPWGSLEFVACCTPDYLAKHGPFTRPEQLLLSGVIEAGETHPVLSRWASAGDVGLQAVFTQLKPTLTVPDHDAAAGIIKAGHGWGFLPKQLSYGSQTSGRLVEIDVKPSAPTVSVQLLYRRKRVRSLAEAVFLEFCLDGAQVGLGS